MRGPAGLVLVAISALCVGCVGSPAFNEYRAEMDKMGYGQHVCVAFKDAFMDLTDVFRVNVAAGEGIGLEVQPTEIGHVGVLFADTAKFGWQDRSLGTWTETRKEGGVSWSYYRSYEMEPIYGTVGLFERPRAFKDFTLRHNTEQHWADFGAEGQLFFLGGGGYLSPKEALDFTLGLVNVPIAVIRPAFTVIGMEPPHFDFAEDDTPSKIRRKHGQIWFPQAGGLEAADLVNDWFELPY